MKRHWIWNVAGGFCFALLLFAAAYLLGQSQNYSPGVHTLQVTIGAGVTQVSTSSIPVKQVFFQNNQTHTMRVGDVATTSSRGVLLASGAPGGSVTSGGFGMQQASDLNQWYVAGTQNDVLDVAYIQ